MANQEYSNLQHSRLVQLKAKDDKNVTFTLGTWGGNTNFEVFETVGSKPWKFPMPKDTRAYIVKVLRKIAADPRPCKESIYISDWVDKDNGKKGLQQVGCIAFGIDDALQAFIDIGHNDLKARYVFPIKGNPRFSYAETSLTEKDMVAAAIEWLIETMTEVIPMAERMSSFKPEPRQGGGGFSGGGGNRGGGGGYGGGNNNNRGGYGGGGGGRQSNSFGSGPDVDSDLHV